jgi:hypothetical protein
MNHQAQPLIVPATSAFFGTIAQRLVANGMKLDGKGMRANTMLRKDEWKQIDRVLVDLRPKTINAAYDLIGKGLTHPLGNIGVVMAEWEKILDINPAEVSMNPLTQGQEDSLGYELDSVPIPIIHKDFRYDLRRLLSARNNGTALDTTHQQFASTKVWEAIEDMLINGVSLKVQTAPIYGYRTQPDRITGDLTASWLTATPTQIVGDVHAMLADAHDVEVSGPFTLYIPLPWMDPLNEDYILQATSEVAMKTVLDRILQNAEIEAVKPTTALTADTVMVEMSKNTVDMAIASDIVNIQWDEYGGLQTRFKVMAAMAPRLKVDGDGTIGIIHYDIP